MPQYHVPRARFRTDDARRHAAGLHEALAPWIAHATAGLKSHRLVSYSDTSKARDADATLCDCAAALASAVEWTGALIGEQLAARGWPVDAELEQLCHVFSVQVKNKLMATLRARASGHAA